MDRPHEKCVSILFIGGNKLETTVHGNCFQSLSKGFCLRATNVLTNLSLVIPLWAPSTRVRWHTRCGEHAGDLCQRCPFVGAGCWSKTPICQYTRIKQGHSIGCVSHQTRPALITMLESFQHSNSFNLLYLCYNYRLAFLASYFCIFINSLTFCPQRYHLSNSRYLSKNNFP